MSLEFIELAQPIKKVENNKHVVYQTQCNKSWCQHILSMSLSCPSDILVNFYFLSSNTKMNSSNWDWGETFVQSWLGRNLCSVPIGEKPWWWMMWQTHFLSPLMLSNRGLKLRQWTGRAAVFMSSLNTHWLQMINLCHLSQVTQKTPWYVPRKFCFHVFFMLAEGFYEMVPS